MYATEPNDTKKRENLRLPSLSSAEMMVTFKIAVPKLKGFALTPIPRFEVVVLRIRQPNEQNLTQLNVNMHRKGGRTHMACFHCHCEDFVREIFNHVN